MSTTKIARFRTGIEFLFLFFASVKTKLSAALSKLHITGAASLLGFPCGWMCSIEVCTGLSLGGLSDLIRSSHLTKILVVRNALLMVAGFRLNASKLSR